MLQTNPQSIIADIRAAMTEIAIPGDAAPMQAYMKDIAPFFGIKSELRRKVQREVFSALKYLSLQQVSELIRELWQQPERELHYLAMEWLYARRKEWTPDTGALIEWLIINKSWWDTVDFLSTRCLGAWVALYPEKGLKAVRRFTKSDNMWLQRSAILHQLHYKVDTDQDLLQKSILPHIDSKEFFIRKAIGWALRHYARTNPVWVRTFVAEFPLSGLSTREALKHI